MSATRPNHLQRALVGFLLAAALFFMEAGWAEISMAQNEECLEGLRALRMPPSATSVCASEFQLYLSQAASKGIVGVFRPDASNAVAWMVMALLYGALGAAFAQLSPRYAIPGFVATHLMLLMVLMATGYLAQFIV